MALSSATNGFEIFDDGPLGAAHRDAHAWLDDAAPRAGRARLAAFLDGAAVAPPLDPRWVHLHWHMLVFELQLDEVDAARARFDREVLPAVEAGEGAEVDGPAGLWHLALSLPAGTWLPWCAAWRHGVRALWRAQAGTGRPSHFALLHHLMAVAGAGDIELVDHFLGDPRQRPRDPAGLLLHGLARALRDFVAGDFAAAAPALCELAPRAHELGGSRAQGVLFMRLAATAHARAAAAGGLPAAAGAARAASVERAGVAQPSQLPGAWTVAWQRPACA